MFDGHPSTFNFLIQFPDIISGNFEITKKERNDMEKELSVFRDSLEFIKRVLRETLENVEKHLDTLEEKVQVVYDYQQDIDYIQEKLIELEDRSRRNNVQIEDVMKKRRDIAYLRKQLGIEKNINIVHIG